MRLVDADEAYKVLTDYYHQRTEIQHKALKEAIERVPTVDIDAITESHERTGYDRGFRDGYAQATSDRAVKEQARVDAVPVVRCKDCKWYKESKNPEMRSLRFCYRLKNDNGVPVGYNWAGNDFCSYGERRQDE